MAFLDETGLAEVWSLVKDKFSVFYQHYWLRRTVSTSNEASVTATYDGSRKLFLYTGDKSSTPNTYYYADSYTVSGTKLVLNNPASTEIYYSYKDGANVLKGKYCCAASDMVDGASSYLCYIHPDATVYQYTDDYNYGFEFNKGNKYEVVEVTTYSEWERVSSSDASAYPLVGVVGNTEYMYVGVPFENATTPRVKIVTGSYTGTGTYGVNNPTTLNFNFAPKMVQIKRTGTLVPPIWCFDTSYYWFSSNMNTLVSCTVAFNGNEVTIYNSSSAANQFNTSGKTYEYIAIG